MVWFRNSSELQDFLLIFLCIPPVLSFLTYCDRGTRTERAFVSHDGGETWTEDYIINDENTFCDLGYPATVELADGSLLTVYYQNFLPEDNYPSVVTTRWNLES